MDILENVDLTRRNTFGMKVRAACLIDYYDIPELDSIFRAKDNYPQPFFHIGGGSNLLFTKDFPGTVLHSKIRFISPSGMKDMVTVRVGAGVPWDEFCQWCAERGLWGPENLSMIPGETGAAAVQNIGAYGREMKDIVSLVECYDTHTGKMKSFKVSECGYGYRTSIFKGEARGRYIVTAVSFSLTTEYNPQLSYGHVKDAVIASCGRYSVYGKALTPSHVRKVIMAIRKDKLPDPSVVGNAGSFFRNPYVTKEKYGQIAGMGLGDVPHFEEEDGSVKIPAAWLIDKCGWKNHREANAGVWSQPLVIVNSTGEATPEEILALEDKIRKSVEEKFGIGLVPEVDHI